MMLISSFFIVVLKLCWVSFWPDTFGLEGLKLPQKDKCAPLVWLGTSTSLIKLLLYEIELKSNQMSWQLQLDPSFFCIVFSGLPPDFFWITALTDSSKISFKPYRVKALHSRYLHLSSFSITFLAVSFVMGADLGSLAFLVACSLRSILLPTNTLTAPGTAASI